MIPTPLPPQSKECLSNNVLDFPWLMNLNIEQLLITKNVVDMKCPSLNPI